MKWYRTETVIKPDGTVASKLFDSVKTDTEPETMVYETRDGGEIFYDCFRTLKDARDFVREMTQPEPSRYIKAPFLHIVTE